MCARQIVLSTAVLAIAACGAGGEPRSNEVLRVSAAVSLSDALSAVAVEYERATGVSVVLNLAGSDTLATQLVAGAPADVFVSADGWQMDRVEDAGITVAATRIDLLSNQLLVVVPSTGGPQVTEVDDLRSSQVRRIAIGDPDSVPAGVYAKQYLESVRLWDDLRSKVVPTRDVRAALAVVAAGNAEVGIVYRTDLVGAGGVSVAFEIPIDQGPPIRYPAAATSGASEAAARRFLAFLSGDMARAAFEDAGFIPLPSSRPSPPGPKL